MHSSGLSPGSKGSAPKALSEKEKGNQMALYEHIFLARQDVTAQQVEAMTEQFKDVIEANGGKVTKVEYWGVKSLAYRIKKNRKAHFSLLNIDAPSTAVAEMERQQSISEDVLRVMTIRVEEHEEGPSAMMRKRDDAERDERGGDRGDRRGPGGRGDSGRAPRPRRDEFASEGGF
jgi:small subunit ribosomal protein S6